MTDSLTFDVADARSVTCPGCGGVYSHRSQYAREHLAGRRLYCYGTPCTLLENARTDRTLVARHAGVALVYTGSTFAGRLTRCGTAWQAWGPLGEFVGWGARRCDAADLF